MLFPIIMKFAKDNIRWSYESEIWVRNSIFLKIFIMNISIIFLQIGAGTDATWSLAKLKSVSCVGCILFPKIVKDAKDSICWSYKSEIRVRNSIVLKIYIMNGNRNISIILLQIGAGTDAISSLTNLKFGISIGHLSSCLLFLLIM